MVETDADSEQWVERIYPILAVLQRGPLATPALVIALRKQFGSMSQRMANCLAYAETAGYTVYKQAMWCITAKGLELTGKVLIQPDRRLFIKGFIFRKLTALAAEYKADRADIVNPAVKHGPCVLARRVFFGWLLSRGMPKEYIAARFGFALERLDNMLAVQALHAARGKA